jgi:hypothetical protein
MAEWKKVIVSGSTANLAALQVDNLTSGQVVIGGGTAGNLTTTAINGTGNIVATTNATGLSHSGSFSGSFQGNFVGTTNLPDLTQGTGITAFTYDGSTTATVALKNAGSLSNNVLTKWDSGNGQLTNASLTDNGTAITGTTSIQLTGANSNLSGSFSGSFQGDGSGLTGVTATPIFPVTAKTDLANTDQFFINDGANKYVTYGNLLTDLAGTNLAVEGTDSLRLASTITGDTTFSNSVVIAQNLTVQGTASFQNTTNLEVADRFVLFASGSNTAGDGGIVVQQGIQNVGELYGYENSINRWGFTSSFNASSPNFTAAAFITTTETSTAVPLAAPLYGGTLAGFGNIHVKTDTGDIYIYA